MSKIKLVHEVRAVKSKKELANIIKAQRISEKVLQYTVAKLRTGISEIEATNLIKKKFIELGAPILSFTPIVAFGENSANIHHINPTKRKLKKPARRGRADIVMLDFGCTVNHYCSDMTRTYFWGEPSRRQKKVYLDVLKVMNLTLSRLKKGERRCKIIDKAARGYLNKKIWQKKLSAWIGAWSRHCYPRMAEFQAEKRRYLACRMCNDGGARALLQASWRRADRRYSAYNL